MKKILLLLMLMLMAFTLSLNAQDTLKNYNLGEVVVTSEKSNLIKSSSVFDIRLDAIEETDGNDITSAIKFYPGMYVTTSSKNEARIYMRGYDQRQVAVFLDGVPIYEPYTGLVDLSNMPKSAFEKITISKGMPSLAYGSNSMGGTINFITKQHLDQNINFNIETGSAHTTSLNLNGGYGNLFYNVNAAYSKSNGFELSEVKDNFMNEDGSRRDNSDYENLGGMFKLGYNNFNNINLAYSLIVVNNEKGVPTDVYTSRPRYWRYSEWKKTINNLMFNTDFGTSVRIKGNVYYENYKNVLNSYDDNSFTTQNRKYAFRSTYDDHSYGLNLLSNIDAGLPGITNVSLSWRMDVHKEEGNMNQGFSKYEASVFSSGLEQDINISQNIAAVAGVGYDLLTPIFSDGNDLPSNTNSINAFAGISYKVNNATALHINASKKNRFPTLKEFYSSTIGRDVANPDLKNEQSFNTELGINYNLNQTITLNSNVFYSSIDDLIQVVFLQGGLRQLQNISKAEMKGVELGLRISENNFNMNFGYTYLSAKNTADNASSDILEYRPEHVITAVPAYQLGFGTSIRAELFFFGNKYGVDADTRDFVKMDNYLLANLKLSHTFFDDYTLYLRINNLTDIYYETEYGFPQPGRELFFGLSCEW
jgi:iron complex outermembrane receptor protein